MRATFTQQARDVPCRAVTVNPKPRISQKITVTPLCSIPVATTAQWLGARAFLAKRESRSRLIGRLDETYTGICRYVNLSSLSAEI